MSEMYDNVLNDSCVKTTLGILHLADEEAYNHSLMVAEIVDEYIQLAKKEYELDWTEEECKSILKGALLHDIGKAFLPFGLQHSKGRLDEYEAEIMRFHPTLGRVSLQHSDFDIIVKNIILMHHANADGSGYPTISGNILTEENVPDYVWLVAYADRFEAMTNSRSFKKAMTYPKAWGEILRMSRDGILPYRFTRLFGEIIREKSLFHIDL